jgi:hypothetical protein
MDIPSGATSDQKLDIIISSMAALLKGQEAINTLLKRVDVLEKTVTDQKTVIESLRKEVRLLKDSDNNRELQQRSSAVRIFNFPVSEGETNLASKIHERIIKPILSAAKAGGELPSVPGYNNTIESAFRVGKPSSDPKKPPPPILVRFKTSELRLAVLRFKKDNMPKPSEAEKAAGSRRFVIVEDLSPASYKKLRELSEDSRVGKVWTVGGQIRFVLSEGDKSVRFVKSVFDSVEHIIDHSKVKS